MPPSLENEYCCCQVFPISYGLYLIALHCFLQAAYASGLIFTSYYRPRQNALIYVTAGSNLCLVPTGIIIFWANLYENWKGARFSGFLMFVIAVFNSITAGLYFFWFMHFRANSLLDKDLFWRTHEDWITSSDFPFTLWHFLSFELIFINFLWFYYARVICRFSLILKEIRKK